MSYSHVDEELRNELKKHPEALRRQGVIRTRHDHRDRPGENLHQQVAAALQPAEVLLVVIADFLNRDYGYDTETSNVTVRYDQGGGPGHFRHLSSVRLGRGFVRQSDGSFEKREASNQARNTLLRVRSGSESCTSGSSSVQTYDDQLRQRWLDEKRKLP